MTLYHNVFGHKYSDDEPCFFTTPRGEFVFDRVKDRWLRWSTLAAHAVAVGHTWQPREVGIPSLEWQKINYQGQRYAPGFDSAGLASEVVVNGEDWTGATGITQPTGWGHDGVDGFIVTDGVMAIQGPVGSTSSISQLLTGTPGEDYVFEVLVAPLMQGVSRIILNGVSFFLHPGLMAGSFQFPANGEVLVYFYLDSGARLELDYFRCYLESELTGAGAVVTDPVPGPDNPEPDPDPIPGPDAPAPKRTKKKED